MKTERIGLLDFLGSCSPKLPSAFLTTTIYHELGFTGGLQITKYVQNIFIHILYNLYSGLTTQEKKIGFLTS